MHTCNWLSKRSSLIWHKCILPSLCGTGLGHWHLHRDPPMQLETWPPTPGIWLLLILVTLPWVTTPNDIISLDWSGTVPVSLELMLLSPGTGQGMELTSAQGTFVMTWGKLGKACPPAETTYWAQHTWTPREYIIPPSTNFVCTASPGTIGTPWLLVICDWLVPKLAALPWILGHLLILNKPDI